MGLFKDSAELKRIFDVFFREVLLHPLIGPKLEKSRMVVRFEYTEPDAQVTFNLKNPIDKKNLENTLIWGDSGLEADVTFKQSADFSNRFWQGKENVIAALAKRKVTASGSITKALQLIPVIRPSFRIYPQVLEKLELNHLKA